MSTQRSLQHMLVTSSFLLPVASICCTILWALASGRWEVSHVMGWTSCGIATILMMELNNANLLIRVRSRMISTFFLIMWTCCGFLHPFQAAHIGVICLTVCYLAMFRIYQQQNSMGTTFVIFLCLGCGTLLIQPLFLLTIPIFVALNYFMTLSFKSLLAGILGYVLPVWLAFSICYLTENMNPVIDFVNNVEQWTPFQYGTINFQQLAALGMLTLVVVPSIGHFLQTAYQDKIRVRMLYYFMIWMEVVLYVILAILPNLFNEFFLILLMNSCPVIGHFLTLSNNKASRLFFNILLALIILFCIVDLWMPLYNFY